MPTIGWFEILIIVAISIIVIGPKDFPLMLKKVGSWIGSTKRYISSIQNEVSNLENENDFNENIEVKKKDSENENGKSSE
jgi:sec-independent protein translocase protein TatB